MRIGYSVNVRGATPEQIVHQAVLAEDAGFDGLLLGELDQGGFDTEWAAMVWPVIGAISQVTSLPVTAVIPCDSVRRDPKRTAQAAVSAAVMVRGGFTLGLTVGPGHESDGDDVPNRLDLVSQSVEDLRALWDSETVTVGDLRPGIVLSALTPDEATLAGVIGVGYLTDSSDPYLLAKFRQAAPNAPSVARFRFAAPAGGSQDPHSMWADLGDFHTAFGRFVAADFSIVHVTHEALENWRTLDRFGAEVLPELRILAAGVRRPYERVLPEGARFA